MCSQFQTVQKKREEKSKSTELELGKILSGKYEILNNLEQLKALKDKLSNKKAIKLQKDLQVSGCNFNRIYLCLKK